MKQSLIIFSGLPGTGKTTLARWLSSKLNLPLLRVDDLVDANPVDNPLRTESIWPQLVASLLEQVDKQLEQGSSVIVDSVFMGADRSLARRLARKYAINFFAIHTFCSDEELWRARVEKRWIEYPQDDPASWEQVVRQREEYLPWNPADALFVDSAQPQEENTLRVFSYIHKSG
ncbi:MAG: ATP-binding protein [Anaerolineales bacterium]|jgi:predicted kinase